MAKVTKQEAVVLDNLGVALGIVARWSATIERVNNDLERTAIYDKDSGEPVNNEARLQSSVALLLEDYLNPAFELMRKLTKNYDPTQLSAEDRATEEVTLTDAAATSEGV